MTALLSRLRKQMNGAVLDSVAYYGTDYGVNMGVSVHSIAAMAGDIGVDDDFARYLYRQQIREMQLIAVRIADPGKFIMGDAGFWAEGVRNSEVAEHVSYSFLSRISHLPELAAAWCGSGNELLAYSAVLAVSKAGTIPEECVSSIARQCTELYPDSVLIGKSLSTLLSGYGARNRSFLGNVLESIPDNPTSAIVREETEWMIRYLS